MRRDDITIPRVLWDSRRLMTLHPGVLSVLVLCYAMADEEGRGHWPSNYLHPEGLGRDDVRRCLQELVRCQLLDIVEAYGKGEPGGRLECGYYLPRVSSTRLPGFVWRLTVR